MIIYPQAYKWLATKWLASELRTSIRHIRYVTIPALFRRKVVAEVYVALNDPHSFMLVQVLEALAQRFNIEFKLFLTHGALFGIEENREQWCQWALKDANKTAIQYGLTPLNAYPKNNSLVTGQQKWQLMPQTLANAKLIFEKTWTNSFEESFLPSTPVINYQVKNLRRLLNKGHELAGSIYYAGEWFWSIGRLEHLERKLNEQGFNKDESQVVYGKAHLTFDPKPFNEKSEIQEITAYISIRSPYSYLGLKQAKKLSEHYGVPLKIKPILPMLMRGLGISIDKQRYIYLDAHREAKQLNIPYDGFCDPIGEGVFNCYQFFNYAEQEGKAFDYMLIMFEAVFVNNIDISKLSNVEKLMVTLGLNFSAAQDFAQHENWQTWSDNHQHEIEALGYWGVPCFKLGNVDCWGQDRLWQIEAQLKKSG